MNSEPFFLEVNDEFPVNKLAHQLFADQAGQHPDRIALVDGDKELTYGELDSITDSIAAGLIAGGIKADEAAGVYIDRSINYIIAILSVMKSGGCYVPIDPDIPADRLSFIINDTGCRQILSESQYTDKLAGFMDKTILLDKLDLSALTPLTEPPAVSPSALAYIIYTSGSTGTPKGVEIEHASLLNLVHWYHKTFVENGPYRATQSAGPGFDSAVCEIWAHLTNGATIYIIPEMLRLQPQKLIDWLTEKKINECFLSSPVAELLLSADWKNNTSLKYLQCGGEKINKKPGSAFPAIFSNRYGPTECTVDSSWALFKAGDDDGKPPHIGIPVSNFRIYILDEELNQVPRGVKGEICIGGAGLARGYRNLPELTSKAFVPDPFLPGKRIYRSGDLGSINAEGNIEYYGRKDFQVKIRGFRIEPGEIEAVLSRHENVSKCVVIDREKGNGIKYLAAYFILKQPQDQKQLIDELRDLMNKSLPEYMVPATYTVLRELPLTLNAKVDRKALPEPEFTHEEISDSATGVDDPLLQTLASIWSKLLKLDYVNPDDNFFMLGGHSLLATALILEIEKQLLVQLPISLVFSHPALKQFSQAVRNCSGSNRNSVRFEKVEIARNNLYPASVMQTAMWFIEKSSRANNTYNIPCEIYMEGDVKPDILEITLNLIVHQNESLRTSFEFINEQLYIKINPFRKTEIPFHDLSILPESEKQRRHSAEINTQRGQVFNLNHAPLFNCVLLKLKDNDFRFIFTVHHLIFDGWSNFLFFKQLADYYYQFCTGKEPESSAPKWQYTDFCRWQTTYLKTYAPQTQLKYWQKKFENHAANPPLPILKQLPSKGQSRRYHVKISRDVTCRLKQLAAQNNASLFMVLTALLQLQIHKYTGATDITTGTTIANRNLPETEEIMGLFINTLALRNEIKGNPSFDEFLEQVKDTLLEAYDNQDVPFSMVLKNCLRSAEREQKAPFWISMILQNLPWTETDTSPIKIRYEELGSNAAKLDMIIVLEERDNMLHGWYEYDTARFEEKDIEALFRNYIYLAETLTENPHVSISEIIFQKNICRRPDCYIIGETALAKAAGEILLDNEFYINGIFTDDVQTLNWAKEHEIPSHAPRKQLISDIVSSVRPDYMFSIVSSCILDQHILDQTLKYAINYHDSPLPRYAGLYSTSWAIINHERKHGVTWHHMTAKLDAGDILKQQEVSISPDDTSGSLDVKCTQAALNAFKSLLPDLKNGNVKPIAQDMTRRTYNPQSLRPADACVIDFHNSIDDISALARALDFSDYGNPMGTLKFASGSVFYMAGKVSASQAGITAVPGQIIKISDDSISIAAINGAVTLSGIADIEGNAVSISSTGLLPGKILTENFSREMLDKYYRECASSEVFWEKILQTLKPPEISILKTGDTVNSDCIRIEALDFALTPATGPLAVFAMFLARISCEEDFDIPLKTPYPAGDDFPSIFSRIVPMRVKIDLSKNAGANLESIDNNLKTVLNNKTFYLDIFVRYKKLNKIPRTEFIVKMSRTGNCELELYQRKNEEFIECFQNFCANLKRSPETPLRNISILSDAEESKILYEWNKTGRDFDLRTPYIRQFEKQAEKYPEKIAVTSCRHSLTYCELDYRSTRLAGHLLKHGIGSNRIIGVLTDKSIEMAIAILGIFKTGCTYMPLDIQRQSPERIEAMIYDSDTEIILSAVENKAKIPKNIPKYIKIIDLSEHHLYDGDVLPHLPGSDISMDDTAYIMYTSGSTGVPKGVMVSQRNLLNHNYSVIGDYALTAADNVLQFSTLGFDISIEEIFPTWLTGGTLIFMPDGMMESPGKLFTFINHKNITLLNLPTSYWHELAGAVNDHEFPDCVRLVVIGGEKASPERFARWRKHVPQTRVINTYGPTETTVIATLGDNLETIGRPIANTHVYVLDKLMQPVPAGVEGELYIAGGSVAKGYLNKPAETAAAFMDNPFIKNERMYKTGDKAVFAPDGELLFAGRIDEQFKIRGFRIEPDDIETVLSRHPDIRAVAVKLWNEKGSKTLVACFVPLTKNYDINNIREFAMAQLPEYMTPAHFIAIDSIPLTPNGKINRKGLPSPQLESYTESTDTAEPQSPLEMQLRLIFSKILHRKHINADASLVTLGVDSLSAIKLLMEIESHTGLKIPFEQLYHSTSINSICNYIRNSSGQEYVWSPVVKLAGTSTSKPPLFLIHTTPGDILGYINLVHYLDDRAVYGIQSLGLNSPEKAHKSIEEMAACYVSEIMEIYPEGPYLICGWCLGGLIAYEMAQQLKRMGRQVAFLGLVETYCYLKPSAYKYLQLIIAAIKWGPRNCVNYLIFKIKRKFQKNQNFEQLDFISQRFANAWGEQTINNMKAVYWHNMNAQGNYCIKYYDGKISLFMAKETLKGKIPLPYYGWKRMSKNMELYTFNSEHDDILREPIVAAVAGKIINCITNDENNSQ
ncbi:MAG: amino acid adenylation domain-containing protein [Lentisphaerota bacterium]